MTKTIRNGAPISISIETGQKLSVVAVTGSYSITITAGAGSGTSLETSATGGTYGPYASAITVLMRASEFSEVDFDVGVTTNIESDTYVTASTNPLTGGITYEMQTGGFYSYKSGSTSNFYCLTNAYLNSGGSPTYKQSTK